MASGLTRRRDPDVAAETIPDRQIEEIELQLLLEALMRLGGYDYREYDVAVLKRRIAERMRAERVKTISALQERVLHDETARDAMFASLGTSRHEPFYEPEFFVALRTSVVPLLRTYAFVRILLPMMGDGEDVYALACLLEDEGLLDRCILYATAIAESSVRNARAGEYRIASKARFAAAFAAAGFLGDVARFCEIKSDRVIFAERLRRSTMFAQHHFTASASINEFHTIVARRMLSHFNAATQYRIHRIMFASLARLGFLCLGRGESLAGTVHEGAFRKVSVDEAIYRRMR